MTTRCLLLASVLLALSLFQPHIAAQVPSGSLTVVSAGPHGEISALEQANEIRVVFSEPMVVLGRIPQPVSAQFFRIHPALPGTFRWSGTTILIFTPDPRRKLPYATRHEVTIDASATAVSGRRLAGPYAFSFTTPTVKLLAANWYRKNKRYDSPMMLALRFNQPVRPSDVAAHASMRFEKRDWQPPEMSAAARARLNASEPQALARLTAKLETARRAASATSNVAFVTVTDWDTAKFPRSSDLVVLEATSAVPPQSRVRVEIDQAMPGLEGREVPAGPQSFGIDVEPAFFVRGFRCGAECDPDRWNPLSFSRDVDIATVQKSMTVTDITDTKQEKRIAPAKTIVRRTSTYFPDAVSLEDVGFARQPPARTFTVRLDSTLQSAEDGQTLGYTWVGIVDTWHARAFSSFGDGHGVWESSGGLRLPFSSRNLQDVTEWAVPISPAQLMPRIQDLESRHFRAVPPGAGFRRSLRSQPDKIEAHGLDLSRALSQGAKTGLVWAGVREGAPVARSKPASDLTDRSTIVQVTNLGIHVKDSNQNSLVFVSRLDNGAPVAGARVALIDEANTQLWEGKTGQDGVAIGPGVPRRSRWLYEETPSFIVVAEKDGDVAYVGSNWHEGISPWEFGHTYDPTEAQPVPRGTIFSDRGVYRPGEEVHFKAILRADAPSGMNLFAPGTPVAMSTRDGQDREIDKRTVKLGDWSSTEWTLRLPEDGALGTYRVSAQVSGHETKQDDGESPNVGVSGRFLVAAYRRPDFRVDATLGSDSAIAGTTLEGLVTAKYLFGASMGKRPITWRSSRLRLCGAPAGLAENFTDERFAFGEECDFPEPEQVGSDETTLDASGQFGTNIQTGIGDGKPYRYTFEGDVEDASRQRIAGRASFLVHPAPWYIGVLRPSYFVDQKAGLQTAIVTVSPDGKVMPGVTVEITLQQTQWHSVRRAEGQGFYTWETTREQTKVGTWTVTTLERPEALSIPLPSGGYFQISAVARDADGHVTETSTSFYALGAGYTAWERFDHNRITLIPEKRTYRPGETARIMVQSPWERATALLTTEREGVRTHRQFELTSSQQSVSVPIREGDIPNVYVSLLLVKGRTETDTPEDGSDPGKPTFRLGSVELTVEDSTKRLSVSVQANKAEYRPANHARVDVDVKDSSGAPASGEVTLWAVDYGVLSLTAFRTPDVLDSIYVAKALQVVSTDNRQRIVSRRVLIPKGADEGGGGGSDGGADTSLRKDFRVLAFWLGSVVTDARGHATIDVKLPESLTTYRIMAVAGDKVSRFGSGESEIRINKPITLKPAFPRFLAVGDQAFFGSVITNQQSQGGTAVVTMRSLDPKILELRGEARRSVPLGANRSVDVRFDVIAKRVGSARIQMTARLNNETDAFEDTIPVEILVSPETVAAYGEAKPGAKETLTVPTGVVPGFGGLHIQLSSTAMVGLGEGARYLVEYPYGCAEQQGSRALALVLAADLGDAFRLPGIRPQDLRSRVQTTLKGLEKFQCDRGGFAYWAGDCSTTSPYLTSYLLHVFQTAASLGYDVNQEMLQGAYTYLQEQLSQPAPNDEGQWPFYTAWQAFAVKVLVEGGRNQDSQINRLYGRLDRMPVFGLAYLADAIIANGENGPRLQELHRRIANAILPDAGGSHVEELNDPYLLWFWNSNVRSTAIALRTLMRGSATDDQVRSIVRWLMSARKDGRWGNTQENAWAMEALVAYYKKYESEVPDFTAVVKLASDELVRGTFKGRTTEATVREMTMTDLSGKFSPGSIRELAFTREGTGTLFYTARLRYAADQLYQSGFDSGFRIERHYAPVTESGIEAAPSLTYKAGDLVRVTLTFDLTKERRFVAVTDPLPAGFEAVESWFATTAATLAQDQKRAETQGDGWRWWEQGGFDHIERHDNRVQLFATRLSEGRHEFSYVVRATTSGTFRTAPAHVEEMYDPAVFGRTSTAVLTVTR